MEPFACKEELAGLLIGYEVHPALITTAARRCGVHRSSYGPAAPVVTRAAQRQG
jgi:hypothetical protein